MTWALKQLAGKAGFHSSELAQLIHRAPNFPNNQFPQLEGGRFDPATEYIYIAPMPGPVQVCDEPIGRFRDEQDEQSQEQEFLDLRFHFEGPITKLEFKETAEQLRRLIKQGSGHCRRVSFLEKSSRWDHVLRKLALLRKSGNLESSQRLADNLNGACAIMGQTPVMENGQQPLPAGPHSPATLSSEVDLVLCA